MELEEWRPVAGFEDRYEVSNLGRVRSWSPWGGKRPTQPRYLALRPHRDGYLKVGLSLDGKLYYPQVHRLVAVAWHGQPKDGQEVRHLDGSRTNNAASNLRWGTRKENAADCKAHGTHRIAERNHNTKLNRDQVREVMQSTESDAALASRLGVTRGNIWNIRNGASWRHVETQRVAYGA